MELIENIQDKTTIILLKETELLKHKSTTYIDNRFSKYEILYNHTNDTNLKKPTNHNIGTPKRHHFCHDPQKHILY